jgi:hypothetical protein
MKMTGQRAQQNKPQADTAFSHDESSKEHKTQPDASAQRMIATPDMGTLVSRLSKAESSVKRQMITQLQHQHGNAFVQRVIAELSNANTSAPGAIQRYAVPSELECQEVVPWLDANSPYAPEWAETRCNFTFVGNTQIQPSRLEGGSFQARLRGHGGLNVTMQAPIDRPEWNPSERPNRDSLVSAWQSMRATLDAHEEQHRSIGATHRDLMRDNYRQVDLTATGSTQDEAVNQVIADFDTAKQGWLDAHQSDQHDIDPFDDAVLVCPAPPEEEGEGAPSEGETGQAPSVE